MHSRSANQHRPGNNPKASHNHYSCVLRPTCHADIQFAAVFPSSALLRGAQRRRNPVSGDKRSGRLALPPDLVSARTGRWFSAHRAPSAFWPPMFQMATSTCGKDMPSNFRLVGEEFSVVPRPCYCHLAPCRGRSDCRGMLVTRERGSINWRAIMNNTHVSPWLATM